MVRYAASLGMDASEVEMTAAVVKVKSTHVQYTRNLGSHRVPT